MRQGNGVDLLGASDPRAKDIGIIYVAPTDDRKSVLASILAQEKVGRKEVAVVLLDQNKAFQQPSDFDNIKNLRKKLRAHLVFIAPGGSGPAELARMRRFQVYSSLENYTQHLQDEGKAKGIISLPPSPPPPPPPVIQPQVSPAGAKNTTADDENDTFDEDEDTLPPPAAVTPTVQKTKQDDEDEDNDDQPTQPGGSGSIITFPQPRTGNTGKLPVPIAMPGMSTQSSGPIASQQKSGNTGKNPVVAAGGSTTTKAKTPSSGPSSRRGTIGGTSSGRRRGRRGWLIAILIIVLLLLVVCGGIGLTRPDMIRAVTGSLPGATPSATVNITPASKPQQDTFLISATTGTPDPAQHQVQARVLTTNAASQPKTVTATGVKKTTGLQATGFLTFSNGLFKDQLVLANTDFVGADGIHVISDAAVDIPAANSQTGSLGIAKVSAHAVNVGANGNILALDINYTCCSTDGSIFVKNLTAFAGGVDPQDYTVVQQSDIDGVVNPQLNTLTDSAKNDLQNQIKQGEKLVSDIQCSDKVTSDHNAGDKASSVTVSVTVTCTGEVYDEQGALTLGSNLLSQEITSNNQFLGYVLIGKINSIITQVTPVDTTPGAISLSVNASGLWVYQFTNSIKQNLAKLIAGKSKSAAVALLSQQPGVGKVNISISGGDQNTLPSDVKQITVNVQ